MVTISVENGNASGKIGNVLVKRGNYSVWSCDGITTDKTGRVLVKHGNYLLHGMAFHVLIDGLSHDVTDGCSLSCKVLHAVHYKDPLYREVYGELIGTRYYRKCPDLMVDGDLFEYESYVRPWNKRKLSNMLTNGLRQSDKIIIDNREGTGVRQIKRAIQSRLYVNATITEVWMYDGNNVVEVYIKNTGVPEGPLQGGAP